jgi:tRNA threonylcarbamoyladenosine biosynthesis protein TsaE
MKNTKLAYTISTIDQPVKLLYSLFNRCSAFTFEGDLGAGKTTLIQHLLKRAGVTDVVVSPTFTYMSVYRNPEGAQFFHFDLYRLKSVEEFLQMGFEEFLYQPHSWALIEWPEIVMPLITQKACYISIECENLAERKLSYRLSPDLMK